MLSIFKPAILSMAFAIALILAPVAKAQAPAPAAIPVSPAPVPPQIFTAKKVFISNVGGDNDISPDHYSQGPDRAYNQFYAAMKSWGRYDLVSAPADAELVFELHFDAPAYDSGVSEILRRPQFRLVILDLKTHVVLWAFTEYLPASGVTHDQSFDRAMAKLVADVQKLAVPPAATSR